MGKFLAIAALAVLFLPACASRPRAAPYPKHVFDLPACVVHGQRGTWVCDADHQKCVCLSQRRFEHWCERNGLEPPL
jgi:hypothetical protein